jgi:hypothetical protein
MSKRFPFDWLDVLAGMTTAHGLPDLGESKLILVSDSREKNGFVIDSVLCTTERSLLEWEQRRQIIRRWYPLDSHGLHYKSLGPSSPHWGAVQPSLHSAAKLNGLLLVVRMSKELVAANSKAVSSIQAKGLSKTNHPWKPDQYVYMVHVVSLVSTLIGLVAKPGQDVHWISDHEPSFYNADQREDIFRAAGHATGISMHHRLGRTSLSTPLMPSYSEQSRDLVSIVDLSAGSMGDTLEVTTHTSDTNSTVHIDHIVEPRRRDKVRAIASWFFSPGIGELNRLVFDASLTSEHRLSVTLVKSR